MHKIDGERALPQTVLIIEWPSRGAADAFYASDEYRPYRESRLSGARNEFVLVAGEDATGAARINS